MKISALCALLALSACDAPSRRTTCTTIGAPSGVTVLLDTTAWPAGEPVVVFDLDAEVSTCQLASAGIDTGAAAATADPERWWSCTAFEPWPADDEAVVRFFFAEHTPAQVTATVFVDGLEIDTLTSAPTYRVDEPAGEGCGERTSGRIEL
jgi:hypothetical protein